jgi:hypothetical protein
MLKILIEKIKSLFRMIGGLFSNSYILEEIADGVVVYLYSIYTPGLSTDPVTFDPILGVFLRCKLGYVDNGVSGEVIKV